MYEPHTSSVRPAAPASRPAAGPTATGAGASGRWVAVVLAGGTSRRWGGRDKTALPLAGRPLLVHAVDAVLPQAAALAVVAPSDHPLRAAVEEMARAAQVPLTWTREEPPGGGPSAGLAAGLAALDRLCPNGFRAVVVLAGDLPFARTAVPRLVRALRPEPAAGRDGALGVDRDGHRQPLLAAYRTEALRRKLSQLDPAGRPVRALLDGLDLVEVPLTVAESLDLDTPEDARRAESVAPAPQDPPPDRGSA